VWLAAELMNTIAEPGSSASAAATRKCARVLTANVWSHWVALVPALVPAGRLWPRCGLGQPQAQDRQAEQGEGGCPGHGQGRHASQHLVVEGSGSELGRGVGGKNSRIGLFASGLSTGFPGRCPASRS
jgi:hypothetical protein